MRATPAVFSRRLLAWYDRHRRELPWRAPRGRRPDPYHVLLSEFMLQQTQVATVVGYFQRFVHRFPALPTLAAADVDEVLRLWQGLGYYSRARNLLATARTIMREHNGRVPRGVSSLLALPGVGRYTAGAIASLAYDTPAALVDGNVMRVLCRLDAVPGDPRSGAVSRSLWDRAEELLPRVRCGDHNSAMMELGATVCTPRQPACARCPVCASCDAFAKGLVAAIPPTRQARRRPIERRCIFCILRCDGRVLIEKRLPRGRWASMWQFPTVESTGRRPSPESMEAVLGVPVSAVRRLGRITHDLSHRRYEFSVYLAAKMDCDQEGVGSGQWSVAGGKSAVSSRQGVVSGQWSVASGQCPANTKTQSKIQSPRSKIRCAPVDGPQSPSIPLCRQWISQDQLPRYALPRPHQRVAEMLAQFASPRQIS